MESIIDWKEAVNPWYLGQVLTPTNGVDLGPDGAVEERSGAAALTPMVRELGPSGSQLSRMLWEKIMLLPTISRMKIIKRFYFCFCSSLDYIIGNVFQVAFLFVDPLSTAVIEKAECQTCTINLKIMFLHLFELDLSKYVFSP